MTIDKLPSGAYRIRLTENKRSYSMTVPFKPTQKEAYELIRGKIDRKGADMSFFDAATKYIQAKTNVLSPSSIRNYRSILRNLPESFLELDIATISEYDVQKLINDYAATHSPKTVHNVNGFVMSVLRHFYPKTDIYTTLPQKPRIEHYTPSQEDIKRILDHARGTKYYIPIYLASMGLRNSEICALVLSDLDGDRLTINKALVRGEGGYILKPTPKTDKSNRVITIPHDLAELIREQGSIYEGYPQQIDKYLRRAQKQLGIPAFGIHRMRHFFASYMHELGYSDAVIQSLGGWSTDCVMKAVYRHALNEDEARAQVANDFIFS